MYYTVYKVTNRVNGKVYIGTHKTKNLDDDYMGSGKYLKRAINKHGLDNFEKEILFIFDSPEDMFAKEAELVNEDFLAEVNTYNLRIGGFGGWDYINSNKELRVEKNRKARKISDKRLQEIYGVEYVGQLPQSREAASEHFKKLHSEGKMKAPPSFKGKTHTKESKNLISTKSKERLKDPNNNGSFGRRWYYHPITLDNIKCLPEEVPEGYIKGRKTRPWNKCIICDKCTGSNKANYCEIHRKENRKRIFRETTKNTDFGKFNRKCSDKEIVKSLQESDNDISKAMKNLGYLSRGGNTRRRFEKILDSMLTSSQ